MASDASSDPCTSSDTSELPLQVKTLVVQVNYDESTSLSVETSASRFGINAHFDGSRSGAACGFSLFAFRFSRHGFQKAWQMRFFPAPGWRSYDEGDTIT